MSGQYVKPSTEPDYAASAAALPDYVGLVGTYCKPFTPVTAPEASLTERDYVAGAAVLPDYRGPYWDPCTPERKKTETNDSDAAVKSHRSMTWANARNADKSSSSDELEGSVSPTKASQTKMVVKPMKSANHVTRSLTNFKKITVPSDKVESVLETMFESDSVSTPPISSPQICSKSISDLVGESVEKILKSPSPRKMDETFSPADNKPLSNGVATINSPGGGANKKWNNTPEKNKENSQPHSNGRVQPPKSQLELALTAKHPKCDKPNTAEKSATNHCENAGKACTKKETNKEETYVEVESELAKMFAGIEDPETAETRTVPTGNVTTTAAHSTNSSTAINVEDSSSSSCHPSSQVPTPSSSTFSSKTKKSVPRKRVRKPKVSASSTKNTKTKQLSGRENSTLDGAMAKRVPVIHIEGPKENPISVQIINSIRTEEEDQSENKMAAKRKAGKSDRPVKKSATDYVLKNYDPSTSDSSWICVFCKLNAYTTTGNGEPSGDLFGPYFVRDPNKGENERNSDQEPPRKKKRVENACSDTSRSEEKSMEVWAHENCIIWAPGVHLIGSKLMGLEEAVWDSLKTKCAHCGEDGANIGCGARQCKSFMHYGCASFAGWKLDVEKFLSLCNLHAGPD